MSFVPNLTQQPTSYHAEAPYRAETTDKSEDILRFALKGIATGYGVCLVTLVNVTGGAARAVGAQMAIWENGAYCGFVSGGCTEAAVAAEAMLAIKAGNDRFLRLGEGSPFFDIVLPCGGGITLAIHVLREAGVLRDAIAMLDNRCRTAIRYDPSRQQLSVEPTGGKTGWEGESFIRCYRPKPRLHLCGRSIELEVTARLAQAADFETFVYNHEQTLHPDLGDLDADTAVVLLYHDIDHELPILEQALQAKPFYIGALGSTRTHQRRCETLWSCGFTRAQTERIHAPIGLIDRARDTQTLALSVIAEIAAVRAQC